MNNPLSNAYWDGNNLLIQLFLYSLSYFVNVYTCLYMIVELYDYDYEHFNFGYFGLNNPTHLLEGLI